MLNEIQRTVILFVFLFICIQAQEVTNVGGRIQVQSLDPFKKPDVDPFGNMKTDTSSGAQATGTTVITKTETVRTVSTKPVVTGSDVKTVKVETITSNTQTSGDKPYVEATSTRKTRIIGSGSGTLRSGTQTSQTDRTDNLVKKEIDNTKGTRGSQTDWGIQRSSGGNRGGGQNNIRITSQSDRDLRVGGSRGNQDLPDTTRNNNFGGSFENSGMYNTDGTMRTSMGNNRGNALPPNDMDAKDKQSLFVRKLYDDTSICEDCVGSGADCYTAHPKDCNKYIRCTGGSRMEALEMDCAFGTFWSVEANTCDTASEVFCLKDDCRNGTLKTYSSGLNCGSYWRCVNGRSHAECCDHGEEFKDGHCIPSDSCKIDMKECMFKSQFIDTLTEEKIACNLEPVPEKGEKAFRLMNHIMSCPDGTKFDTKTCGCIASIFNKVRCNPTVDIAFVDDRVIDNARGYIQTENITVTGKQGSEYALFKGTSELNVPYFKNNENIKSHLVVSVRFFKSDDTGHVSQVLASNCKTKHDRALSPSFAILLNKKDKQIVFFASTKKNDQYGATQHISLPYTPGKWTTATLKFLDEVLYGTVETLESDGTSKVDTQEKVLKGTLNTSIMPLMIGTCNMNDGFFGYIHKVKAYMCNPDQI